MTQVAIDTTGEVVEDNAPTERPPEAKDIPVRELPIYSVKQAIEWAQRPENASRIEHAAAEVKKGFNGFVAKVDEEVGKVGRLMIDMGTDDNILEEFKTSLWRSITGIKD